MQRPRFAIRILNGLPNPVTGMSVLQLTRAVYDQIRSHGEQTYPHECCGALLGHESPHGWIVEAAIAATNARLDSPHNRYQIAPAEVVKLEREARQQNLVIAGFYHSHPDHLAHWSATDLAEAHWLGCCYVITEVAQGKAAATNAFLLAGASEEQKCFEKQTIRVTED